MTETELKQIETALDATLPENYRRVSLKFPFEPIGNDWVYWMYDDPEMVIGETQAPLVDGEYDKSNWRESYVVIGQSASGDPYLIDTAIAKSPVFCLSHETHEIETEWNDFGEYVADWLSVQKDAATTTPERDAAARLRRRQIIVGVLVALLTILIPFILFVVFQLIKPK